MQAVQLNRRPLGSARIQQPLTHKLQHLQPRRRSLVKAAAAQATHSPRLSTVLQGIDELNSQDPRKINVDGVETPYELAYSQWLTHWVLKLTEDGNPPASEEVLIVARGQHVQRWTSARTDYPEGRAGYLKWREDLKKFHAKTVAGLMQAAGYPADSIAKVESIINKKNLKDPENQIIEDGLCLVFLERQFAEFRQKETEEKMVDILRKTWRKMGPKGQAAALAMKLGPEESALVAKALAPTPDK